MTAARQQCEPCGVYPVTSSVSSARASCCSRNGLVHWYLGIRLSHPRCPSLVLYSRIGSQYHCIQNSQNSSPIQIVLPLRATNAPSSCCLWKWGLGGGGKNKEGTQEGDDRAGVGVKGVAMGEAHWCRVLLIWWERRLDWL